MSKYDPLRDHLAELGKETLTMTFSEVGRCVGGLPKSSEIHRAWWANEANPHGHVQARAWMDAGYAAEPDMARRRVTFRKVGR
ncbi:DUF7662 domain-containing protein [Sphingosinicella humi]|uniref:DUF7662 domain-containing protein n=1 Tax=Allosphingosinicella humi TaxID=2068657 RepID=A0A2U2J5C3_9SPHN|nr:hypothetical protein [Sphingosinicella humi]PWG03534.1 hypothetical protein DF286_12105 [Sphingosinicella humi]